MARLCVQCKQRPALFKYHGKIKADKTHTLCQRCFRDLKNSLRLVRAS